MAVTNQLDIQIEASSSKASKSLDTLIGKLNEVNTALNGLNVEKINQISNSLKGIKGVHLNTGGSGGGSNGGGNNTVVNNKKATNSFNELLSAVTRSNRGMLGFRGTMVKMAATWGTFYAAMYPAIRLFKFLGSKVGDAMDYTETFNYFKVTMNKIGHDAGEEFTDSFYDQIKTLDKKMTGFKLGKNGELFETGEKSLGLDPTAIMDFQAQIGSITNSMGLLGKTSIATQKALSMLASDYSSLRNIDLEESMKKFTSGLIGQSRALYSLGIDITNMKLKEYALAHGVTKSVSAMTQGEKAQLRMLAILDQSKVAWGDQANTISSVANQYRIFKQQVANLGRVLGNLFLPIVKTVLPYVNAFVIALRRLFNMLGFKLHGENWLSDLNDGISDNNFNSLNEDIEDTESAINGATKAAKKFKQATMGFDELNIINPESSGGSGSGSGGGASFDLSDDIETALEEYEEAWDEAFKKMQNKAEEIANKFMSYVEANNWFGLGDWIGTSLTHNLASIPWETVYSGAKGFGKGLAEFLNGLISPDLFFEVGKTVASSLNTALYTVLSFGETFNWSNFGKSIGSGINGFFKNYDFVALAETLNVWVDGLEKTITNAIKTINWGQIVKDIGDFLTHLDFDTVVVILGAVTISKIGKFLMDDVVKKMAIEKLSEFLASKLASSQLTLGKGLKLAAGVTFAVQGLTIMFDGMQNDDFKRALLGSLETTGGITLLTGGGLSVAVPVLVVTFSSVAFKWLTTPDKENGSLGLIKLLKHIKLPGGSSTDWNGNEVKLTTNLHIKLKEMRFNYETAINNAYKDIENCKQKLRDNWDNFTLNISTKIDSIKEAFELKWSEMVEWWNVEVPNWLEQNVKPKFSKETWNEIGKGIKDGLSTKWSDFTDWWSTTGFFKWWNDDVLPWFDEKQWTFEGIQKGLSTAWNNAITVMKSTWNAFADWMNDNLRIHIDSKEIGGHKLWDAVDFQLATVPKFNIPKYAVGGFPEDGLFMANHGELVGKFSNGNTAVANNEQIIEGIRSGVASAVSQTLAPYLRDIVANTGETANNTDAIKNKPTQQAFTDRDIAKANIRGQRSLGLQLRTT